MHSWYYIIVLTAGRPKITTVFIVGISPPKIRPNAMKTNTAAVVSTYITEFSMISCQYINTIINVQSMPTRQKLFMHDTVLLENLAGN